MILDKALCRKFCAAYRVALRDGLSWHQFCESTFLTQEQIDVTLLDILGYAKSRGRIFIPIDGIENAIRRAQSRNYWRKGGAIPIPVQYDLC